MKKLIISLFVLIFAFSITAFADFPDVKRDDSEKSKAIYKLADAGIVGGFEDGTFRPDEKLTRAQLCKIVNLVFGYNIPDTENFKDVKTTDWFYPYVLIAKKAGYIKGFEDNTFRGNSYLTREQTCIIISRTAGLYDLPSFVTVKDEISDWAKADVMKVIANFVMPVSSDGKFRAKENITRAELAMALDGFVKATVPESPSTPSLPSGPSLPVGPTLPAVTYYTVKFYNAEGMTISVQSVEKGKSAVAPAAPEKKADEEYIYTFYDWDKIFTVVYSNLDVHPQYTKKKVMYTVNLNYGEGTTGTMPGSVTLGYNDKLKDVLPYENFSNGKMLFGGWYMGDKLVGEETYADLKPETLTAKWVSQFTVKFYDANGEVIKTQSVKKGQSATAPTSPKKSADKENTYTFNKWSVSYKNVTSDLDVYPEYTATPIVYTVKLEYGEGTTGTKPESVNLTYNQSFDEVLPTTAFSNGQKVFDGWYSGTVSVKGKKFSDIEPKTLTAKWTETYEVVFYDAEDNVITSSRVKSGESATAPNPPLKKSDKEFSYSFKGWSENYIRVNSDLHIYPTYTPTQIKYTVTLDYKTGKTEQKTLTYNQPVSDILPTNITNGDKLFAGWYAGNELIDNERYSDLTTTTITAKWTDTFTVKFYNAEGKEIKSERVEKGKSATAPASPVKKADKEYTYSFKSWDKSYTNIQSDLDIHPEYTLTHIKYTVTLDYGTGKTEDKTLTYNQSISDILPTNITNGSKTFAGWYVGEEKIETQKYSDLEPSTITAKWVTNFTVKFYNAEGKVIKTVSVKKGQSATPPTAPKKEKDNEYTYDFAGWDKSYTDVQSDLDIYPEYTPVLRMYKVYLSYSEGTEGTMPDYVETAYNAPLSEVLPTTAFKNADFLFIGWYIGEEKIDSESYADLSSTTLTAKWGPDPEVMAETKAVRDMLHQILLEIKDAESTLDFDHWEVVKHMRLAISKTYDDALIGYRVNKAYVLKNYSNHVSDASNAYKSLPTESLNGNRKEAFGTALGFTFSPTVVDFLIDYFDINIGNYT